MQPKSHKLDLKIFKHFLRKFLLPVERSEGKVIGGYWATDGCYIEGYNQDKSIVKCACNHFTNFALLVDVNNVEEPVVEVPLDVSIISYVGCIILLVCVVLTMIAHTVGLVRTRHHVLAG